MDGKQILINAGLQRRKADKYGDAVGKAIEDELKKAKKSKKEDVVLESKDITEPLNTYTEEKK